MAFAAGSGGCRLINKLEFLLAVAREQNFRRAAEACGVAQPTLSAGIKQLEDTLGVMLVRRSSHFQGLTPEGERVLEWAKRLVSDARAMQEEIHSLRKGLSGGLRIAVIPTALPYAPALTMLYRSLHPKVGITILSRSSIEIMDMLGDLQADAGITYLDNENIGRLRSVPLYVERYRLLTTQAGPMGQRQHVTWAEVGALPLCLLTPDMQNRRILDRLMTGAGTASNPCMLESDSIVALIAHVRRGDWVTVVSEHVAEAMTGTGPFWSIPITEPDATFRIGLVTPDRQPTSPMVSALIAAAERLARQAV